MISEPETVLQSPALLRLPFDQYGRYRMIQEVIGAARPALGARLRVLDVGGYSPQLRGGALLPARMFLPDDDVTVIDQVESDLAGYVRGDGRGLMFPDRAFDFVISCDTLEHVPGPDRLPFWRELLRVARYGVALAAPFASPEVVAAEDVLFAYIKAELGIEQGQLKEHRGYGLPDIQATRALLDAAGLPYRIYPSGYTHAWLAMMAVKHYLLGRTGDYDLHEQLDAYYTRFFGPHERREPAYRHVFVVARDNRGGWLEAADAAITPTIRAAGEPGAPEWRELAGWFLQLLQVRLAERQAAPLAHTVEMQAHQIAHLQQVLAQRDAQIADLEARSHWLEQQASETRRLLAAVEHGRVMRILRWLTRQRGRLKG